MVVLVLVVVVVMAAMVVLVLVVVVVVAAMVVLVLVVVVVQLALELCKFGCKRCAVFHCLQNLLAVEFGPRRCDDCGVGVMRPYQLERGQQLLFAGYVAVAEHYARRRLNLVVEEFAEVLHVHLALVGIDDCSHGIYPAVGKICPLDRLDDVRQLAHARRLD